MPVWTTGQDLNLRHLKNILKGIFFSHLININAFINGQSKGPRL